jgi:hypothetical protein
MMAHMDLSSAFFLYLLTSIDFRSFSVQPNHLNFGSAAVFFHPVSPEILSLRSRHQAFLPDDQSILVFILILLLQHLVSMHNL